MKPIIKGNKNVYEQVAEQYKTYISLGVICANEKLPSCRELAYELGINPNTVERAYSLLEAQGYVFTIPKKGVYVSDNTFSKSDIFNDAKMQIYELYKNGISYAELMKVVDEIYGEDDKK